MRLLLLSDTPKLKPMYDTMRGDFLQEQQEKEPPSGTPFLIEHAGEVVGFCNMALEEECFPDEDLPETCLKVYAFYIKKELRNKTFGSQAFKLIREWGRDNKAALLETSVSRALDKSTQFLLEQGLELVGSGPKNIFRGFI